MDVIFTKGAGSSYTVEVRREKGPALAPRGGPGGHAHLPHDLVHLIVEQEVPLSGGVFGQLAAGDNGIFWPADPAERRKATRRSAKRKQTPQDAADMARSEQLAQAALPLWELRHGHLERLPKYLAGLEPDAAMNRILERCDAYAERWHALPVGGSLTVAW